MIYLVLETNEHPLKYLPPTSQITSRENVNERSLQEVTATFERYNEIICGQLQIVVMSKIGYVPNGENFTQLFLRGIEDIDDGQSGISPRKVSASQGPMGSNVYFAGEQVRTGRKDPADLSCTLIKYVDCDKPENGQEKRRC